MREKKRKKNKQRGMQQLLYYQQTNVIKVNSFNGFVMPTFSTIIMNIKRSHGNNRFSGAANGRTFRKKKM
jgi:hypothetical protein